MRRPFPAALPAAAIAALLACLPLAAAGTTGPNPFGGAAQSLNPDISVIIDGFLYYDNSEEGLGHVYSEIVGFGHDHAGDEHAHHHGPDQGLNLRHVELALSGEIDPYFRGQAIGALLPEGAELEEGWIETTGLPAGFRLKLGKFFSDFGRVNPQHEHEYDFTERPLANQLVFGDHGLNDLGAQLSWLAPTNHYLLLGLEAFQGNQEEGLFPYLGEAETGTHDGPRVGVAWIKYGPPLPGAHGLVLGSSLGTGRRQEEHDGNGDGVEDHWLDGTASFWGLDAAYKYDSSRAHGRGDLTVQAEYLARRNSLEVARHDLGPALEGSDKVDQQDGYYVQATYGLAERWRAGVRWEQVGVLNKVDYPDGTSAEGEGTSRLTVMGDFTATEFSRLRLGLSRGEYATAEGREGVWGAVVQLQVSLGAHGAHKF